MLEALLNVVVPVFAIVGVGFAYSSFRAVPIGALTDLILHITGACLIVDGLTTAERLSLEAARVPVTAVLILFGGIVVAIVAHRVLPPLRALPVGAVILPTAFMNAGNLGLPVAHLALGRPGLEVAMLYFVTMASFLNSLGVAIMAGRGGAKTALSLPLLHAAWIGILLNQFEVQLPKALGTPIHLLGQTVVPLMLLALGARLRELVKAREGIFRLWGPILLLVGLRTMGGTLVAISVVALLGNTGPVAQYAWITGAMPPAVMNFVLVEKYANDPEASAIVSGAIALGTGLAMVTLPIALSLVR